MPTERFEKLKEEKKRRILTAGYREFTRVPAAKVSINSIIREAGISRGSFYTYFRDKEDLLGCILEGAIGGFFEEYIRLLDQCGGDLFLTMEPLYLWLVERMREDSGSQFIKNIFSDQETVSAIVGYGDMDDSLDTPRAFQKFCRMVQAHVDTEKYSISEEQMPYLQAMILMLVVRMASVAEEHPEKTECIRNATQKELDIIKYGALRRN